MLNARHLIISGEIEGIDDIKWQTVRGRDGRVFPFIPQYVGQVTSDYAPIYRKIADFNSVALYENLLALPRAYTVRRLMALETVEKVRHSLVFFDMLPWYEAAVSEEDLREIGSSSFSRGSVSITKDLADEVTITANFGGKGFVVLADQFYPGWKAYIDGSPSKIYKTNSVLRGVVVPGGNHVIEFKYVPLHLYAAMAFSTVLLAFMLFALIRKTKVAQDKA